MTQPIKIKNTILGEGTPKICAPIAAPTEDKILESARHLLSLPIDLVEWRVDFYENAMNAADVLSVLKKLRTIFSSIPLIFTFRTKKEGGEKKISTEEYFSLALKTAESHLTDFIDIEYFIVDDILKLNAYLSKIKQCDTKIILSNHDFYKTPPKDEILKRLQDMQALNCDIPKIAVMPNSPYDVLALLDATYTFHTNYSTKPFITMSMSSSGCISRISGKIFGSCITFGAAEQASAPGQIPVAQLKSILELFH